MCNEGDVTLGAVREWEYQERNKGRYYTRYGDSLASAESESQKFRQQLQEVSRLFASDPSARQVAVVNAFNPTLNIPEEDRSSHILLYTRGAGGVTAQEIRADSDPVRLAAQLKALGLDSSILDVDNGKPIYSTRVVRGDEPGFTKDDLVRAVSDPPAGSVKQVVSGEPTTQTSTEVNTDSAVGSREAQKGEMRQDDAEQLRRDEQSGEPLEKSQERLPEQGAERIDPHRFVGEVGGKSEMLSAGFARPGDGGAAVASAGGLEESRTIPIARNEGSSGLAFPKVARHGDPEKVSGGGSGSSATLMFPVREAHSQTARHNAGVVGNKATAESLRFSTTRSEHAGSTRGNATITNRSLVSETAARTVEVSSMTRAVRVVGPRTEEMLQWREVRRAAVAYVMATAGSGGGVQGKQGSAASIVQQEGRARGEQGQRGGAVGDSRRSNDARSSRQGRDAKAASSRVMARGDAVSGIDRHYGSSAYRSPLIQRLLGGPADRDTLNARGFRGSDMLEGMLQADGVRGAVSRYLRGVVARSRGSERTLGGKKTDLSRRGLRRGGRAARGRKAGGVATATKGTQRVSLRRLLLAVARDAAIDVVTLKIVRDVLRRGFERVVEVGRRVPLVERTARAARTLRFRVVLRTTRITQRVAAFRRAFGERVRALRGFTWRAGVKRVKAVQPRGYKKQGTQLSGRRSDARSRGAGGLIRQELQVRWLRSLKGAIVLSLRSGRVPRLKRQPPAARGDIFQRAVSQRGARLGLDTSRTVLFLTWFLASIGVSQAKKRRQFRQGMEELRVLLRDDESLGTGDMRGSSLVDEVEVLEADEREVSSETESTTSLASDVSSEAASEPVVLTQVEPTWNLKIFTARQEDSARESGNGSEAAL